MNIEYIYLLFILPLIKLRFSDGLCKVIFINIMSCSDGRYECSALLTNAEKCFKNMHYFLLVFFFLPFFSFFFFLFFLPLSIFNLILKSRVRQWLKEDFSNFSL